MLLTYISPASSFTGIRFYQSYRSEANFLQETSHSICLLMISLRQQLLKHIIEGQANDLGHGLREYLCSDLIQNIPSVENKPNFIVYPLQGRVDVSRS